MDEFELKSILYKIDRIDSILERLPKTDGDDEDRRWLLSIKKDLNKRFNEINEYMVDYAEALAAAYE